ncbi:MAG TPA: YfhO family protein [Hyphomicrobiaceae bacterium]|nr:YfhO family protein [Hyphomicrobiaceae bacterium]
MQNLQEAAQAIRRRLGASGLNGGVTPLLLAIAVVWVIAAGHWVVTDTVVPWDSKNQFYAFFRFLAASLQAGQMPFWDPYHYGGHPSVADPQSLVFAPAFVLWAYFDPLPSLRAFDLVVYAHLLVGGLAVGLIGWRAGWPLAASLLAAAVFMLGGPASGRLQHTGIILSYGLFPLALLLIQIALARRSHVWAAVFGVVAALLAVGRNQCALLICFVLAALLVAEVLGASDRWAFLKARLGVLATMAFVSVALLAIPFLLTIQFAALSNRPEIGLDEALEGSLYPVNLASLAIANVLGSLETVIPYWGPNSDTVPAVGATDGSFNYLFVGATTMVIVLWFGVAAGGLWRRDKRFMTGVLVAAGLFMLGRYTPIYPLAFEIVPGVSLFRRPVDGAFIFCAALAMLAGGLLAAYVREGVARVSWQRLAAAGAGAVVIVAWAVLFSARTEHAWMSLAQVLKAVPIVALTVTVLVYARSAQARAIAAACVTLLATGELLWWNTASALNAEDTAGYSVLQHPGGSDAQALAILEAEISRRLALGDRPRVEVVGLGGPWQNLAVARGFEATNGYNPLRIGSYDRLVSPGETTYALDQRLFPMTFEGYDCALARELGLEYVVLGRPIEEVRHLARRPVSDVLLAGPDVWIYRLRDAAPRVAFMTNAFLANNDVFTAKGQYCAKPALNGAASRRYALASARHGGAAAQIVSWERNRVEIDVMAAQGGILVLHDLYYPGWVVDVDGKRAAMLRADSLFRGVEVGEGHHRVVFRYEPFSLANLRDAALALVR